MDRRRAYPSEAAGKSVDFGPGSPPGGVVGVAEPDQSSPPTYVGSVVDAGSGSVDLRRRSPSLVGNTRCVGCGRRCDARRGRCNARECWLNVNQWARDWFFVFLAIERALDCRTRLTVITAPGSDALPWDPLFCSHRGDHVHSGRDGCRLDRTALVAWTRDAEQRLALLKDAARKRVRRNGLRWRHAFGGFELQRRGALHVNEVFDVSTDELAEGAEDYVQALAELAPAYGYGFVDRLWSPSMGGGAASYIAGALDRFGRYISDPDKWGSIRDVAFWQERLVYPPTRIAWASSYLTRLTGVTIRSRREGRREWARRGGEQ